MLLYSRKKVRYRRDGYCWKKRKDGKTTREDHMKLKVQGTEVSSPLVRNIQIFLFPQMRSKTYAVSFEWVQMMASHVNGINCADIAENLNLTKDTDSSLFQIRLQSDRRQIG